MLLLATIPFALAVWVAAHGAWLYSRLGKPAPGIY